MPLGPGYRKLFAATSISNLGDGVGQIAYPWLASAVTRNPVLIALVAVCQRLPWLVFSLPAGVLTDRYDRRLIMVKANVVRAALTTLVAVAVLWRGGDLPSPDELDQVVGTESVLYACVLAAALLLGVGEVFHDNSAQTLMPQLVATDQLERANGRMYSAEIVTNLLAGPPLASLLLAVAFALPFFVDAASFAVSAVLILAIGSIPRPARAERRPWRAELAEGFTWLWRHDLLRPLAITLGLLTALGNLTGATLVLYAQEVLDTSTTEFAALTMAAAVGGVVGGWTASRISERIGYGPSLWLTIIGGAATTMVVGVVSLWPVAALMFAVYATLVVLWNIITVSFRQAIIPDHLRGRVNSVYRFFGWGMIPLGALAGGAIVAVADAMTGREAALRAPWIVAGIGQFLVLAYAAPKLTTARMDAARAAAMAATETPIPTGQPGQR